MDRERAGELMSVSTDVTPEAVAGRLIVELERPRHERGPVEAGAVVDCILRLEARSRVDLAETLRQLWMREIAERGAESGDEGGRSWDVARELSRQGMDERVRRAANELYPAIARRCLEEGPGTFGEQGARWGSLGRAETKLLAEHFQRQAPLLRERYRRPPAWSLGTPSTHAGVPRLWPFAGIVTLVLLRLVFNTLRQSQAVLPFSEIERRVKTIQAEAALPGLDLPQEAQRQVRLLNDALQRRDCDSAARTWHELGSACAQGSALAQRWVVRVRDLAGEVCESVH